MEIFDLANWLLVATAAMLLIIIVVLTGTTAPLPPPRETDPLYRYVPRTPSPRALTPDLWTHVRSPKDQRYLAPVDSKFAAVCKESCPEFKVPDSQAQAL